MRKITQGSVNAFINSKNYKQANTEIVVNETSSSGTITQMFLFGNLIAEHSDTGLSITNAGFQTNTTKERLNGLPGVRISQKNGQWYLNGREWDGEWIKIS